MTPRTARIRTITAFVDLGDIRSRSLQERIEDIQIDLTKALRFLVFAAEQFRDAGFEVQTTRIATSPLEKCVDSAKELLQVVALIEEFAVENRILVAIGPLSRPEFLEILPRMIQQTSAISCCAVIQEEQDENTAMQIAKAVVQIGKITSGGEGNFRFAAAVHCPPNIPFFPTAYQESGMMNSFAIGLENSALLCSAFKGSNHSLKGATMALFEALEIVLRSVQTVAKKVEILQEEYKFVGIDTSICPSIAEDESIVCAFESIKIGNRMVVFGGAGTLAVARAITSVLQSMPVDIQRCGYNGLMLPAAEDMGLAARAGEGKLSITNLLSYSSVCGTGIDTVPIPGDTSAESIALLYLDVVALSNKMQKKPLSVRIFPVPDAEAGNIASFENAHLINCPVFPLDGTPIIPDSE